MTRRNEIGGGSPANLISIFLKMISFLELHLLGERNGTVEDEIVFSNGSFVGFDRHLATTYPMSWVATVGSVCFRLKTLDFRNQGAVYTSIKITTHWFTAQQSIVFPEVGAVRSMFNEVK